MGIEPLRLSLRTESKITLGATSLSKWLIAFKWQCFNVHNVLGIFQSFSIAVHHIRKPKKSIWVKIEARIFSCESSVQTSIHSIHCGFVWGRQDSLVFWVSISFPIPIFLFYNWTSFQATCKWMRTCMFQEFGALSKKDKNATFSYNLTPPYLKLTFLRWF